MPSRRRQPGLSSAPAASPLCHQIPVMIDYCPRSHQCKMKVGSEDWLWLDCSNNNTIHFAPRDIISPACVLSAPPVS